ncbi:hypothetical protein [uncultured Corynebacterium sp.]|uniref:hypothetical protein n=1 Tax=uncultured Corynebacterium sp. TaxID=159447 RepID=UPI0025F00EB3|nr:hypothetical protein [uncultured Corynebacterium sp.]
MGDVTGNVTHSTVSEVAIDRDAVIEDAVGGSGTDIFAFVTWKAELRNMWKPTRQENLWFMGGNLHQGRHYPRYLSLQLAARHEGWTRRCTRWLPRTTRSRGSLLLTTVSATPQVSSPGFRPTWWWTYGRGVIRPWDLLIRSLR